MTSKTEVLDTLNEIKSYMKNTPRIQVCRYPSTDFIINWYDTPKHGTFSLGRLGKGYLIHEKPVDNFVDTIYEQLASKKEI